MGDKVQSTKIFVNR